MNSMSCYSCCRTEHDAKVSGGDGDEVHQAAVMVMLGDHKALGTLFAD